MTDNIQKLYEIAGVEMRYLDFICKNKNCEHKKLSGKFACVNCWNSTNQNALVHIKHLKKQNKLELKPKKNIDLTQRRLTNMENKKIYIDGVDVSGCEYFKINKGFNCYKKHNCNDKECYDCYYKQLKRLESQCEGMFVSHTDLEMKYKAKEQECERLNKDIERWKSNFYGKVSAIEELLQQLDQLKAENDLLRQHKKSKQASYESMQQQWNEVELENRRLKKENKELKKQACGLRPELKYIIDKTCCKYNINAKYYHEKIVEIINNLDKYKQTLIEIKEMLQVIKETNKVYPLQNNLNKILQKISEVEE